MVDWQSPACLPAGRQGSIPKQIRKADYTGQARRTSHAEGRSASGGKCGILFSAEAWQSGLTRRTRHAEGRSASGGKCGILFSAEAWQSGLTRRTRNAVGEKSPRRFESSRLRTEENHDWGEIPLEDRDRARAR